MKYISYRAVSPFYNLGKTEGHKLKTLIFFSYFFLRLGCLGVLEKAVLWYFRKHIANSFFILHSKLGSQLAEQMPLVPPFCKKGTVRLSQLK